MEWSLIIWSVLNLLFIPLGIVVLYYVIKTAVKNAIREVNKERQP